MDDLFSFDQIKDIVTYFDNDFNERQFEKINKSKRNIIYLLVPSKIPKVYTSLEIISIYFDNNLNHVTREEWYNI